MVAESIISFRYSNMGFRATCPLLIGSQMKTNEVRCHWLVVHPPEPGRVSARSAGVGRWVWMGRITPTRPGSRFNLHLSLLPMRSTHTLNSLSLSLFDNYTSIIRIQNIYLIWNYMIKCIYIYIYYHQKFPYFIKTSDQVQKGVGRWEINFLQTRHKNISGNPSIFLHTVKKLYHVSP